MVKAGRSNVKGQEHLDSKNEQVSPTETMFSSLEYLSAG
jgi:hypothetical protein